MDLFKNLIEIDEKAAVPDDDEVHRMSKEELEQLCRSLSRAQKAKEEEYDNLLEETSTVRREYDEYRLRTDTTMKQLRKELQDERQIVQDMKKAAEQGGSAMDQAYCSGLEDQLNTLREQARKAASEAARWEKRALAAENARVKEGAERREELDAWSHKMKLWKERAAHSREAADAEIAELRRRLAESANEQGRAKAVELVRELRRQCDAAQGVEDILKWADSQSLQVVEVSSETTGSSPPESKGASDDLQSLKAEMARVQSKAARDIEDAQWETMQMQTKLSETTAALEQTTTALAAAEAKVGRLSMELEEKERTTRAALKKKERDAASAVEALENRVEALTGELRLAEGKVASLEAQNAHRREAAGEESSAVQRELRHVQSQLEEAMTQNERMRNEVKVHQEHLHALKLELQECREELWRKEQGRADMAHELGDVRQQLIDMGQQAALAMQQLQDREEGLAEKERERQVALMQQHQAEQVTEQHKQTIQLLEGRIGELELVMKNKDEEAADQAFRIEQLSVEVKNKAEDAELATALAQKKDEELASVRKVVQARDAKIDEILRFKDSQSAKLRHAEQRIHALEMEHGSRSRTPARAIQRALSPAPQRVPPGSTPSPFFSSFSRTRTVVLAIIAALCFVGLYTTHTSTAGTTSLHTAELERNLVQLKEYMDAKDRVITKYRDELAACCPAHNHMTHTNGSAQGIPPPVNTTRVRGGEG